VTVRWCLRSGPHGLPPSTRVTCDRLRPSWRNVTISAGGASRVLSHLGTGTLGLFGLEFSGGEVIANPANGGCIRSQGNVSMNRVVVHDCHLYSMQGAPGSSARGGGVYARGTAFLDHSSIFNNSILPAIGSYSYGEGAGVHAYENVFLEDSTISGNVIYGSSSYASGGGFSTRGGAGIAYSSISGNSAQFAGAGRFGNPQTTSEIRNSTISGNAGFEAGGIVSNLIRRSPRGGCVRLHSDQILSPSAPAGSSGGRVPRPLPQSAQRQAWAAVRKPPLLWGDSIRRPSRERKMSVKSANCLRKI